MIIKIYDHTKRITDLRYAPPAISPDIRKKTVDIVMKLRITVAQYVRNLDM